MSQGRVNEVMKCGEVPLLPVASRDRHAPPYVWLTIRAVVNVLVERHLHLRDRASCGRGRQGTTLKRRAAVQRESFASGEKNVRGAEGEIEVVHILPDSFAANGQGPSQDGVMW